MHFWNHLVISTYKPFIPFPQLEAEKIDVEKKIRLPNLIIILQPPTQLHNDNKKECQPSEHVDSTIFGMDQAKYPVGYSDPSRYSVLALPDIRYKTWRQGRIY